MKKHINLLFFTLILALFAGSIFINTPVYCAVSKPYFKNINDHKALIVDGRPHIVLAVFDQVGFSNWDTKQLKSGRMQRFGGNSPFSGSSDTIAAYEAYYKSAKDLGFNTVMLTFLWRWFETDDGNFVEEINDSNPLYWHKRMAEKYGMKIIIRWFATNIGADNNCVPAYIQNNASYQSVIDDTGKQRGIYCYNYTNILEKEKRAIKRLMDWLKKHDLSNTYIMVQINNEIQILSKDRCHCSKCNSDFLMGRYNAATREGMERFNQEIMRSYIQQIAKAIHEVIPGFIAYINVWPHARGSADPFDERGRNHYQEGADPYVKGWLDDCPDLAFIGPDIYHIGYKSGDVEESLAPMFARRKNWWHGQIFPDWYKMPGNVVFRAESGCIVMQNEKPYRDIFDLLGPKHNAVGDCVYGLAGSQTSSQFQALLTKDLRWLRAGAFHQSHDKPYFIRNSFVGIRNAVSQIAQFQNTDKLLQFSSKADNNHNCSGEYKVGSASVSIKDNMNHIGKFPARARGMIIAKTERDYTFIGVDYTAILKTDARNWPDFKAESGYWVGDDWHSVMDELIHPVIVDNGVGFITFTMPMDDVQAQKPHGLQYCIRVYDASGSDVEVKTGDETFYASEPDPSDIKSIDTKSQSGDKLKRFFEALRKLFKK